MARTVASLAVAGLLGLVTGLGIVVAVALAITVLLRLSGFLVGDTRVARVIRVLAGILGVLFGVYAAGLFLERLRSAVE